MFTLLVNGLLDWMVDGAVEGWKTACKYALQAGVVTDGQWSTVNDVVGKLGGVLMVITVACAFVGIAMRAWRKDFGGMFLVAAQAMFAWPLTLMTLWVLVQVSNMATSMTDKVLGVDLTKGNQTFNLPDLKASSIKGAFAGPLMLIMLLIVLLASASIICCMAARSFLLIVAACFVGMAWMVITGKTLDRVAKYASWTLGIILYQPICAILIYLTGQLMKTSGADNPMTFVTALVGMFLASVCPWVIIGKITHILPGGAGVAQAADSGEKTVDTVKDTVEKVVSAGAQVAADVATGTAGAALPAGGAGGGEAGLSPIVDRPEQSAGAGAKAEGGAGAKQDAGGSEAGGSSRFRRAVAAAASAVPATPGVQGAVGAFHALNGSSSSASGGRGSSSSSSAGSSSSSMPNTAPIPEPGSSSASGGSAQGSSSSAAATPAPTGPNAAPAATSAAASGSGAAAPPVNVQVDAPAAAPVKVQVDSKEGGQ